MSLNYSFNGLLSISFMYSMFFLISLNSGSYYITSNFYIDDMTIFLKILTCIIVIFCLLSSYKYYTKKIKLFLLKMGLFCVFTLVCFTSSKIFFFFIFFEFTLMPTVILVLLWGKQPERFNALLYFLFYGLVGSIPLFIKILFMKSSSDMKFFYDSVLCNCLSVKDYSIWVLLFWLLAFFIKLPMWGLHMWLPKAHVEAPVYGSMLLAAILLKLGVYGVYRMYPLINLNFSVIKYVILVWGSMSLCLVGVLCFRQNDMKSLIAYSSIAHMGIIFMGFTCISEFHIKGGLLLSVGHGFVSSSLFFFANVIYGLSQSRNLFMNQSVVRKSGLLILFGLLMFAFKSSLPPTMNFMSEVVIMLKLLNYNMFIFFPIMMSIFVSGLFCIYCYLLVSQSKILVGSSNMNSYNKEYLLNMGHLVYVMLILVLLSMFIKS